MNYDVEIKIDGLDEMSEAISGFGDALGGFEAAAPAIGTAMGGLAAFAGVMYVFSLIFVLAQYIMNGIAYLRMAKKLGIPNGWLGFIPIADLWLLGKIADANSAKKNNAKRLLVSQIIFWILAVICIISTAIVGVSAAMAVGTSEVTALTASMIPFAIVLIGFSVAAVFVAVYQYIAQYRVCDNFGGKNGILWFLGMLLGGMLVSSVVPSVLMLILSFKTPKTAAPETPILTEAEEKTDTVF